MHGPGMGPISSCAAGLGGLSRGATPAARASPPDCPRNGGRGALGQWDWGSENAGMKAIVGCVCLLYYMAQFGR